MGHRSGSATYPCGTILEDLSLGLGVLQRRLGDGFLDSRRGHGERESGANKQKTGTEKCKKEKAAEVQQEMWRELLAKKGNEGLWVRHGNATALAVNQWRGMHAPLSRWGVAVRRRRWPWKLIYKPSLESII